MNDPYVTALMPQIRSWSSMPIDQAKAAMKAHMESEGGFSKLDYELVDCSLSVDEAVGVVYGI